jgi:hypothetical protein
MADNPAFGLKWRSHRGLRAKSLAAFWEQKMSLWQQFMDNRGNITHKYTHYFPIYERHFAPFRDKSIFFLEIGVFKGGSLPIWQKYFGPLAKIVGIDIFEPCKESEAPGISVRIGDQSDEKFLQSIIDEFGVPDIVLDDGSHQMHHISKTFNFLYPKLPKNGIYMVEDLHTAYWEEFGGGVEKPDTFINMSKRYIDSMNANHSRGAIAPDIMTSGTFGISFYDSIVVFERADMWRKETIRSGHQTFKQDLRSATRKLFGWS